jgi:predicted TIM-barrel fold metal-dependent hydrolase
MDYPVIDADGHVMEPASGLFDKFLDRRFRDRAPKLVEDNGSVLRWLIEGKLCPNPDGPGRGFDGKANDFARKGDPKTRLEAMELEGVQVAVLYPSMGIWFGGVLDAAFAVALCRAYNDWIADYCSANPERLRAVGILPVQDVGEARRELARAVRELGLVGGVIALPIPGKNPGDRDFHPLYAEAQELDAPVAFHSAAGTYPPPAGSERFDNFFYTHTVGHPFEQMLALASLVGEGVLELFPRLRVAFLEGGAGWVPFWAERLDEHYEKRAELVPRLTRPPGDYIRSGRVFVSCESEERILPAVLREIGESAVVYASDYPHWDCAFPHSLKNIASRTDLSESQKRKLLCDNARNLYRLPGG